MFNRLFAPREELVLDEEEMAAIAELQIKHPYIWKAIRKYLYNKINIATREIRTCNKERLPILQDRMNLYLEIEGDFVKIKKLVRKKPEGGKKLDRVKDFWHYITNQDIKQEGKVKLTGRPE